MDTSVETFRSVLRDNRNIVLTHKRHRHKARDITAVLYASIDTYIVVSKAMFYNEAIFLVHVKSAHVRPFEDREQLHCYLAMNAESYKAELNALFPKSPLSSCESSTDSY